MLSSAPPCVVDSPDVMAKDLIAAGLIDGRNLVVGTFIQWNLSNQDSL